MGAVVAEDAPEPVAPAVSRRDRREFVARTLIVAAFAAVVAVTMWRHEMWRDELQAWMIARSSTGLRSLAHNVRYEGHPMLWYAVLLPLTKVASGPWPMQVLQLVVSTTTVALVVWRAPFTLLQKALFAAGYFAVFEYGVLSRSYSLGFLYAAIVCSLATAGRRRWLFIGLFLALLALTSAFGLILAGAIGAGLGLDEWLRRRGDPAGRDPALAPPQELAIGAAIALAGALLAYAQSTPPSDSGVYRGWRTDLDTGLAGTSLAAIWRALVPIPRVTREFWNTNALDGRVGITAVLGVGFLALFAWLLRRRPAAAVVWVAGAVAVVGFLYGKIGYASASRHYGHVFLALVAALWLAPSVVELGGAGSDRPAAEARSALWSAVLTVHVVAGVFAVALDIVYPFSNGRDVARYIEAQDFDDALVVGQPDVAASTVAAYLDHDVYYPAGGRFGQYVIWDRERIRAGEPLAEAIRRVSSGSDEPVLLVVNRELEPRRIDVDLLARFDDGIVADEHFWVYRVRPASPGG